MKTEECGNMQMYIKGWMDKNIYDGILFSREKGRYLVICKNMDGTWAHYPKWDKWKRQKLYDTTSM